MAENKKPMSFDEWANAGGGAVKPVETGLAGRAGDLGLSLLKGAIAVPEAAVGAADIVTGGKAGKKAEELGFRPKEAKAYLDSLKSDAAKDAQYKFENADGFTGKLGAAVQNPSLIANAIAESVPLMGAGGVVGRGLVAAAPRLGAAGAAAAGEGVVGAGSAAEGIRQETTDGELTGKQSLLAAGSGAATGLLGLGGAKAAKALGVGDIDQAIVGGTTKVAGQAGKEAPGMLSSMGRGALSEGVFEELPQSLSEQAIQNVALDKPWTQDLDAAAAMGLLTGGAMGGGMGLIGRQDTPAAAPPAPAPAPVPPAGPAPMGQSLTGTPMSSLMAGGGLTGAANPLGSTGNLIYPTAKGYPGMNTSGPDSTVDPETGAIIPAEPGIKKWVDPNQPPAPLGGSLTGASMPSMMGGNNGLTGAPLEPIKPSEQMGLNPAAGPLSAAAVTAVDGDATPSMQAAAQATAQQEQTTQAQQQSDSKLKSSGWTMNEFPVGDEPMVASLDSKDAPLFMTQATAEDGTPTFNVRDTDWNVIASGSTFEEAAGRAKVQQASGGKAQVTPQTTGATDGATPAQTQQISQKGQAEQDGDWSMGAKPIATPHGSGFQDSTAKRAQGLKAIRERNGLNKPVSITDEGKTGQQQEPANATTAAPPVQPGGQAADAGTAPVAQGAADTTRGLAAAGEAAATGQPEQAKPLTASESAPPTGGDDRTAKALDRVARGTAYFAKEGKANEWIKANGLTDTHTVEQDASGANKWNIVAKTEPTNAQATEAQQTTAQRPEAQPAATVSRPSADARKRNLATLKARMMAGRKPGTVTDDGTKQAEAFKPWRDQFEKAKADNDKDAIRSLYDKVRVALNGPAQANGESVVALFNALKTDIEQFAKQANPTVKPDLTDGAPVSNEPTANSDAQFAHAGLKLQTSRVKVGDDVQTRWVVQSPENAEREARGERQIGGDRIVDTREQAIQAAEQESKKYASDKAAKAEFDAKDAAEKEASEAKKQANRGKSIAQRRVDAILEKPSTVGQGSKREVIESAVRNGRAIVEKMVDDTAAKKRDREAVDRVSRAGYILGLSNENIPVVKAGLEAQARLKADKYQKPEYRMYSDSREDGPFREISKTEYDYAQSVKSKPGEAAAPAPTTEAAPAVETLPDGWTDTRNGFTDRPVYRFNQGTGQPFAVVTETDDGYEVQVRHGDKQVSVEKMPGASRAEALSSASGMLAEVSTHKDPGEKSEAVTPTVVADAMKKAARNEDVKPADMKKWLLAELDKAMLEAPDREDYDATVKSFSAKDAEKMWTGNGPYGKDTHTGFLSFDVPGDGKFKVRNGMRGLLEFKQNVERSKGFSNTGARTAAPERNNGVQDGSGGRMSAITNMIDEGDFEAARDYAEAVGIPLADVKVPRGERKPQWDAFMKNGTVPPQPDTKPQPAPKTAAELDAEKKAAREAEANKPGDTGWNMAGEVDDVMADLRGGNAAPESDTYQSAYDTEVERMRELADKKGVPASGINDDLSASLASLSIGRGFNQSVDEFLSANPSKKGRRDAMMAWRNGQIDHKPGQSEWAKRREAAKPTEPTADAETAQKEAGSDKKFPAFPVDGYQLERFYANGAKVKPLPAKVFSQDEVRSITDWFKSIGWNVTSGSGANGVSATNDVGMTVDDLPEPYTATQRKKYEAQRAADERAADKKKAQGDYLSSTEAGRFVSAMFGDAMNSFNLTALAKMLAGDEKTFNGMFSNRAADVLNESGISTEGREVKDVIRDIKAKFDLRNVERKEAAKPAEAAPAPKLTPAEAEKLMEWQDLGQKDGVKTHILTFYESKADKDALRGRMTMATVSKGDRSPDHWMVDGDDTRFGIRLAAAKKRAMEMGMAKAVADGFVEGGEIATQKAEKKAAQPASKTPTVDAHSALMDAVRTGKATPEQFKAGFEAAVNGADAIKAELATKTKADLLKMGGYAMRMRYANDTKPEIIDALYREILGEFVLGESLTYGMGKNSYQNAIRQRVEATDADKLSKYAVERKAAMEEYVQRRFEAAKAIANPQKLEDFRGFIRAEMLDGKTRQEAYLALSPEQRIRFDELEAESTRDARESRKRAQKTQVQAAGQTTGGQIVETKHTKTGQDLFVVQLSERLSKEDYTTVLASAKRMGGWYSAFRGNGAVPGFQFKEKAGAEAFLRLAGGDTSMAAEQVAVQRDAFDDDKTQTAAERLNEMADKLEERADEELGRERNANTARRARFAASAEAAASNVKALAKTMRNIAKAIGGGTAKFLDAVRTKTQVEMLSSMVHTAKYNELVAKFPEYSDREKRKGEPPTVETADFAEFPTFTAFRSDLATLARQMLEVDGTKKLGQQLMSVADDVTDTYLEFAKKNILAVSQFGRGGAMADFTSKSDAEAAIRRSGLVGKAIILPIKRGENRVILSPSEAMNRKVWGGDGDKRITLTKDAGMELVQAIGRKGNKENRLTVPWQFETAAERLKALSRIGIETPSEFRSAIREFIAMRVQAQEADRVKAMERAMVGRKNDGLDFFPTPAEVADQMVEAAGIEPDMAVLEPSAGMGHLADRIRAAGAEPDVIELSGDRRELLTEKGFNVIGTDFMAIEPRSTYTYGDVFRHKDGRVGILGSNGGMGSTRFKLIPMSGDKRVAEWVDIDDLTGIEKRGSSSGYDRIIMNPPFGDRRDAEHVRHAYSLLKPGGRLVAIMGEGVFFGKDKKAEDFREWLDTLGGTSEKLPDGSFMDPSLPVTTGVNARMVVVDREEEAPAFSRSRPAFSRAAQGQASGVVQSIVDAITARWANAPKVVVAFDMNDPAIPERVRQEDQRQRSGGAEGTPEGFYYKGTVYLMSSKLANPRDVVRVLFHEALGHAGLRGVFGKELKPLLQQIATMRKSQIEAKMKEYGLRGVSNVDRLIAAEEVLAEMAQSSPQIGFVRRAVATVKAWLRKHVPGFMGMNMSDDEIITSFLIPARNYVVNGGPNGGPNGGVRFSRSGNGGTLLAMPEMKYPKAGSIVDGRVVRDNVPNMGSISAELDEYTVLPGVREVPISEFTLTGRSYSVSETKRIEDLAERITDSGEINPLIVVIDAEGPYILEGGHRAEALFRLGAKSFPAVVVTDDSDEAMFSRSIGGALADGVNNVKAFDVTGATGDRLAHYRGMGMQVLGRRQIVDLYGDMLPELKAYDSLVQKMDADKNESGAEADALVSDWAKLDEHSALGFGAAKNPGMERKLAELMHDATLAQIDPDKPIQNGDDAAQHASLAGRFNALSPKAQEVYRTARDMYADHFKKVQQAIQDRIQRSSMDETSKAKMIARMDADLFNKLKGVYFPLARFGKYVVVSKNADGETVSVSRAETLAEANNMRREVVKNSAPGVTVSRVYKDAEFNASRDAVGKGFVSDLMTMLQGQGVGEDVLDSVGQLYLASMPDLSWAKHGIHRKGTPGFSQDARRAFAQNMFHGARHLAKLRYSDQLADKLMDMEERVKDQRDDEGFDQIKAQQVVDEMNARHETLMNPKTSSLSTALTSLGFVWFLGISPASAMVNLSQTALVAYPVMAAKWGFQKAGTALLSASAEVARAGNDLGKVLKGEELAAFQKAVDDGTIDVTQAHDLAGVAQGEDERVAMAMRPVMRAASFMFHHAEKFNRQATFIAAYRLAKENGADADKAFEQAKKATYDGHFDYSASNRPRLMQGNWQKVLFLFKQYGQNMVYTLTRQAYLSMKGMTPEQRTEARKQLGGLLAMHAMAAGALGLPLVGVLLSAASMAGGDDDEPWDAEVALKNMMADAMGPKAAEVMAHGLSRLTPWDLSGRVALNKLILPDIQEGLEGQPLWEKMVTAAAGPVAGIGGGFVKGMAEMGQGQYQRGLESMLPVALKNTVKAMRFGEEGAVDKTGVVIKDEVGAAGVIGQALGFRPSDVALATEGKTAIYQADKALTERRSNLVRLYAMARMNDDSEGTQDALDQVRQFNEKNPNRRITMPNLMQSVRNRQRRIDDAEQGVYLPKNRRDALEAGRFAMAD